MSKRTNDACYEDENSECMFVLGMGIILTLLDGPIPVADNTERKTTPIPIPTTATTTPAPKPWTPKPGSERRVVRGSSQNHGKAYWCIPREDHSFAYFEWEDPELRAQAASMFKTPTTTNNNSNKRRRVDDDNNKQAIEETRRLLEEQFKKVDERLIAHAKKSTETFNLMKALCQQFNSRMEEENKARLEILKKKKLDEVAKKEVSKLEKKMMEEDDESIL